MHEKINSALKAAETANDKSRVATLRLILAAIKDRDTVVRQTGRDGVGDDEVLDILQKMVRQREVSTKEYEETGQLELAAQEQKEAEIIREFLPGQIDTEKMRVICEKTVQELGAHGLKDIGRCMSELKARYPGQMDFVQASCVVRDLLRVDNNGSMGSA